MRSQQRLSTLIASAMFLQACSSTLLQEQDTRQGERGDIQQPAVTTPDATQPPRDRQTPETTAPDETAPPPAHVWEQLAGRFSFALEHYNEDVEKQIQRYIEYPDYLPDITERAAPFIYEISQRIEKRGMPGELALLPIVESAFNPRATSGADAAGLWQFMAPTAAGLGLKRDWWYDGRLDPLASTDAALDYLEGLHEEFDGDWLLALAGYNAGRGTVSRAMRQNERRGLDTDFWSLPLPRETRDHVPRLLALARIFAAPGDYELELEPVPLQPALVTVDAGSQIDLRLAAELAGMEPEEVYALNTGYRQWATHPDGPHTLLLPPEPAERLSAGLESLDTTEQISWERYEIRSGDTLGAIARRFDTDVQALRSINELTGDRIIAGDELMVPRAYSAYDLSRFSGNQEAGAVEVSYTVRPGDSLWRIANEHQLSVDALRRWNQLGEGALIQPGQELIIRTDAM
ncbi:MAG: LysM peptidoglycan-binding domain-containing protein [Pseudohongiellaceae bacterium]